MNTLFTYQADGVSFLVSPQAELVGSNRLLAWEEGSGKTPVAVSGADAIGALRILVVCPPIALGVWLEHFRDWSQVPRRIVVIEENAPRLPEGDCVCIVAYSRVWSVERALLKAPLWDLLVLDETHFIKSTRALRTQAVYGRAIKRGDGVAGRAHRVWCLTGTPVLNHALDLYPHLKALAPELIRYQGARIMTEEQFAERFCVTRNTRYGPQIVGSKNTEELHERLKPFMSRVRKRDLGLPPLTFAPFPLPPDIVIPPPVKLELNAALARSGVEQIANDDEFIAALKSSEAGGVIRRLLGVVKAPYVAQIVEDLLAKDPARKALVFAHHRDVISLLARLLKPHGVIVIDGSVAPMERAAMVKEFQRGSTVRVAVLNIVAAGTAATMHRADEVVFAEASWVPNENNQAAARAHRVGQTKSVMARFVVLPGTVDERIQGTLVRKSREIGEIVDGEKPSRRKISKEQLKEMERAVWA